MAKGSDLADRLMRFAVAVIGLCRALPDDYTGKHLAHQLIRAATGAGANYEEARGAESTADFVHKISIAKKEAREALYWLRIAKESGLANDEAAEPLVREAGELTAILMASAKTAKGRLRN